MFVPMAKLSYQLVYIYKPSDAMLNVHLLLEKLGDATPSDHMTPSGDATHHPHTSPKGDTYIYSYLYTLFTLI